MKLNTLILASTLMMIPNLYATPNVASTCRAHDAGQKKATSKPYDVTLIHQQEMHGTNPCLDQCIIVTGLLCCLPCIAFEQCYKRLFPRFKSS
jgi:hypothetical protein